MTSATRASILRDATQIVTLLVVLSIVGTGCQLLAQGEPEEAGMTVDVETVRKQFRADLQEVERLLQPAQFKSDSAVTEVSGPCDLPDGSEGQAYLFRTREFAGHVADPKAKANLVADHWRSKGYKAEVATEAEVAYRVTARPNQGGALSFIVGEPGMTLSAETPCASA